MNANQLTITPLPAHLLSAEHISRWSELQKLNSRCSSPYFRPEFTLAVADVCNNVEVAVLEQGGEIVGFFPYQRVRRRRAIPVGGVTSDYHGVIAVPGTEFSPEALLKACGLTSWHFSHLVAHQTPFRDYFCHYSKSLYLDLSRGYDAYIAERRQDQNVRFSKFFANVRRQARNLAREVGPLRVEIPTSDPRVLETLFEWKRQQYRRTRTFDVLRLPWTRPLLRKVFRAQGPDFSGLLMSLYAGDRLIAIDFGIRSGRVLHGWFRAHDPDLSARYSPGHALMLETLKIAPDLGIEIYDLGKGGESYKRYWSSREVPLSEGVVDLRSVPRLLKSTWIRAREWVRESPLYAPARRSKQLIQPCYEWLLMRSATHMSPSSME